MVSFQISSYLKQHLYRSNAENHRAGNMRATIKDVAEKSGVSIATVSRAFNQCDKVDHLTRERILTVAHNLKYSPSAAARSLSTHRTETIALLLPDLFGEFFSEVIRGVDESVQGRGYHLVVSSSHNNRTEIATALHTLRGRVDGLIVMSPNIDAETLTANIPLSLPVVLLNCQVEDGRFDVLNIDNFQGSLELVRHLIRHGHSRIAIIKGTENNLDAKERLRGYHAALIEAGLPSLTEYEVEGDFSEVSGFAAVEKLLKIDRRPTALFASNDSMAIGALSALRSHGISVPLDMIMGSFDDIPVAEYIKPSLTTVSVKINELGKTAVLRLVDALEQRNNHVNSRMLLPTTLVIRESCGCTRA